VADPDPTIGVYPSLAWADFGALVGLEETTSVVFIGYFGIDTNKSTNIYGTHFGRSA
jgi:hypothetical protein